MEFNYIDTNNMFIIACYHIYIIAIKEIRRKFHKLLSMSYSKL